MIFCVEDEQNICELEVYTLQSVGMEAQGCGSGRELFRFAGKAGAGADCFRYYAAG